MFSNCFWGKKHEKNGLLYWLPLYQHLEDTTKIAVLLWQHWMSEGQRTILMNSLDIKCKDRGKDLVIFLAMVHDIGKCTPAFQIKKGYGSSTDLDVCLLNNLERAGFNNIRTLSLSSPKESPHNIAGQYLLEKYGVCDDISSIVGAHHGKPVNNKEQICEQCAYKKNYYQSENKEDKIYKKWETSQKEILNLALKISNFNSVDNLPKVKQAGQVILSGLLIMADWIASNHEYFPLIPIDDENVIDRENRAIKAFSKWQKTYIWEPDYDYDYIDLYDRRFGFMPRNVQSVLSEVICNADKPGIFILEAPMGIGKTEASLIAIEQLAYKTGRSGVFFGLPTMATSNGIFPRILEWLKSISEEQNENMQIRLSHSKAYLNDKFIDLANGVNIDEEDGNVIVNEWFSGRKTSALDDFVVGTVDGFLMLALKQKHLALRHLGFSKKVVVIDEVHAYDAYMSQYLLQAVKWLGAYRVPLVILSATLPSDRRIKIIKNYMLGMGQKINSKYLKSELQTDAYPLITYNDGDKLYQVKDFEKTKVKRVSIIKLKEEMLFELVEDRLLDGGILGIIVNTVKKAQSLAKEMESKFGKDKVDLLHSAFISTDRVKKENCLLNMIGSNANRPFSKIIIGTQVIEQSLDIDFDVLISDLAPMDLLIQRMGRLHRHNIERPQKHRDAKFYVLGTSENFEFESGSAYVYGEFILARTQYYLPKYIDLPNDISKLVQNVYDFNENIYEDNVDLKEKYDTFKSEHTNKIKNSESKAKVYRIDSPVLKKTMINDENLIGWLKNVIVNESDEKANAMVRDICPTIEVIALKQIGSGYGLFGTDKDISKDISEYEVAKNIAKNTVVLPRILSQSYNIDRTIEFLEKYTLKNLYSWQKSIWLKGALGIIFDSNNEFVIENIKIIYDEKYGICVERK